MSGQVSNNIMRARQARGYSQEQIAKAIGVSRPTYINIETGKKELTISQADALSSILRISIGDILGVADDTATLFDFIIFTDKYKQIILNALRFGADSDGKITKTKLAKLVYLVDFIWYYENSKPMSGMAYRKLPRGPVADVYFRALDEMEDDGVILREQKGQAIMFSLVEKEAPNGKLSKGEVNLIKKICKAWQGKSTEDIVNFTHEQLPWQICLDGEVIPYGLIFQEEPEKIYGPAQV
ncbi:MAG: DUF4065 domain-containing protein [Candidatus Saccharibacteria bacterium]|nr:DUF4065 domain-containing protein [Candidatus Saccharibacteria bacterium]